MGRRLQAMGWLLLPLLLCMLLGPAARAKKWTPNIVGHGQVSGYARILNHATGQYDLQSAISFTVCLYDGGNQLVRSAVITDGYYLFTDLVAGAYTVVATPNAGAFYGETSHAFKLMKGKHRQFDFLFTPCEQPVAPTPYVPPVTPTPYCPPAATPCPTPRYEDMTQTGESLPVAPFVGLLLVVAGGVAVLLFRRR